MSLLQTSFYKYIFLVSIFFLYIYDPSFKFLPNAGFVISVLAIFYCVVFKTKLVLKLIKKKFFTRTVVIFGIVFAYALVFDLASAKPIVSINEGVNLSFNSVRIIRIFIEAFLGSLCLLLILYGITQKPSVSLVNWIIPALIALQGLAVIVMLISPEIRDFFFYEILKPTKVSENLGLYRVRGYGVSWEYLFSYPIFNGMVIFLFLLLLIETQRPLYYVILILLATAGVIFNARTGLLFFLIAIPFILMYLLVKRRNIKKSAIIATMFMTFSLLIFIGSTDILLNLEKYSWSLDGFMQIISILSGNLEDTTLWVLLDSHIYLPKSFTALLFGDGTYVYGVGRSAQSFHSDIGYVNQIYFGGLLYVILMIILYANFFHIGLKNSKDKIYKYFLIGIFIGLLLVNFKGAIFYSNPATKFLIVFALAFYIERQLVTKTIKITSNEESNSK